MRTRTTKCRVDLADNRRVTFYASVFDQPTQVFDFKPGESVRSDYTEVVRPGSFTDTLAENRDVIANVDHDPGMTFAKRSDGSLLLQQDGHGLFASAWLPEGELGDGIINDIANGTITGASFRFKERSFRTEGDTVELLAVELEDVTLARSAKPAYPGTEVHLRTKSKAREWLTRLRLVEFKQRRLNTNT